MNAADHYDANVQEAQKKILLTRRETECVFHLTRGCTAKEIGKILNISNRTVESYLENIKRKFCCQSRSQLIWKVAKAEMV